MADVIYEFTANHGSTLWTSDPAKMVDGTEASYAYTTVDGDIQRIVTNEGDGSGLGAISKVELRAYAYGDSNDQLIIRPIFGGVNAGDNHTTVPGVAPGSWGGWQDITSDTNRPSTTYETHADATHIIAQKIHGNNWLGQTFTPGVNHSLAFVIIRLSKTLAPSGTLTVGIRATVAGKPVGGDLASGTLAVADIGTSMANFSIAMSIPYSVSAAIQYAVVLYGVTGDASNYVSSAGDAASPTYAGGAEVYTSNGGADWTINTSVDLYFAEGAYWTWTDVQNLDCEVETNDVSKGNTTHCGMVQMQVTYEAAGETFYKTIEGTLTSSGVLTNKPKKSLAGSLTLTGTVKAKAKKSLTGAATFAGTVTKKATKTLAGALTMAGVVSASKILHKALAGALTFSGDLKAKAKKSLAGTLAPAGALAAKAKKVLTGSLTPAGAVTKKPKVTLAGTLTMAGDLSAIKKIIKMLEGAITFTGTLTAKAKKVLAGSITPAGAVTKKPKITLAGTLTMAGAVIGIKKIIKILEGAITFTGELKSKAKKALAGTLTPTGTVTKKTTKTLAGTFTSSGIVTAIKKFYKTIEGAITFSGDLAAKAKKVLTGSITPAGAVTKKPTKTLAGALTMAGAMTAKAKKVLAGTLTPMGAVTKKTTKTLAGTLAPIGTVVKKTTKSLAGALTMAGDLFAELAGGELFYKTIEGAITFTGTLTKKPKKVLSGTLTMIGTLAARIRGTAGLEIRAALNKARVWAGSLFTGEIRASDIEPPDIKGAKKL